MRRFGLISTFATTLMLFGIAETRASGPALLTGPQIAVGDQETFLRDTTISAAGAIHHHRIRYTVSRDSDSQGTITKADVGPADADLRGTGSFKLDLRDPNWTLEDGSPHYDLPMTGDFTARRHNNRPSATRGNAMFRESRDGRPAVTNE